MTFHFWIYSCIIGNLEFFLLGSVFFGLEWRSRGSRIVAPVLAAAVGWLCYLVGMVQVYAHLLWIFLFLGVGYRLSWRRLTRYTVLMYLFNTLLDEILWSICFLFPVPLVADLRNDIYVLGSGVVGFVLWCVLCVFIQKRGWKSSEFFKELSVKETVLFCNGIFIILCLFALVQGFYLGEMNESLGRAAVAFCIMVVILMIGIFFYLGFLVKRREYLEEIREADRNYLQAQRQYLEQSMRRQEELKGFRHDVREHFQVMELLVEKERLEELKNYLKRIQEGNILQTMTYTGNVIADALFHDVFGEVYDREEWSFSFLGRFPEELPLDEMELCILLSNAFRNAREALEKCEQKRFYMEIRDSETELGIQIENSAAFGEINIEQSSKTAKEEHGYGVKNMRKVVEKHDGEISWEGDGERMIVRIYLPKR